jgi:hypothetical protein
MKVILEMHTKLCFINESSVKVNMRIQREVNVRA